MKVIIWGINYMPELTGIGPFNTALCEFLVERGCAVDMVTSFPYYPEWRKKSSDRGSAYRTDYTNGVTIHRCWTYVPRRTSALQRIVHEASFVLFSLLRILVLNRPSVFVIISPPLLLGVAAWIASIVKKAPIILHVQDLQPDAAVGLGMLRKGWLTKVLYWIEGYGYSKAAKVSGISEGMLQMFRKKGVPEGKLILFPNGIRLPTILPQPGMFRARNGISEGMFLAIYSGNLGIKQGLTVLIDAAKELARRGALSGRSGAVCSSIVIVVAGDGSMRAELAKRVASAEIANVLLLPLQSETQYREMLSDANCSVITQQAGTGSFFFPSKLLSAVATGKPVLTVADDGSELAKAVRSGGFGINVQPGRPDLLADTLVTLATNCAESVQCKDPITVEDGNSSSYSEMGVAGLKFAEEFEMNRVLEKFRQQMEAVLEGVAANGTSEGNIVGQKRTAEDRISG